MLGTKAVASLAAALAVLALVLVVGTSVSGRSVLGEVYALVPIGQRGTMLG